MTSKQSNDVSVPEPVSPEGGNVIHVPRIPGTVNTPVGPMIPKSEPVAAPIAPAAVQRRDWSQPHLQALNYLNNCLLDEQEVSISQLRDILDVPTVAAPIAPAAEKLIAELVSALESLREMCEDDCTGIDGRCPVCRAVNKADVALTRAAEYRKGAKHG